MKVELTPCFILHSRPYLESSLLLDIFSREYGRLHLIAKGAKREKSRHAGLLQPYQRLLMAWRGKSELMTLTDVEDDIYNFLLGFPCQLIKLHSSIRSPKADPLLIKMRR